MELNNNKGYVMTDASIAVLLLLILVPTIMGIIYSSNVTKRTTDVKSQAINIAVNAIEAAKGIEISSLTDRAVLNDIYTNIYVQDSMSISDTIINGNTVPIATIKKENASYKLLIDVKDYSEGKNDILPNIIKTVTATVTYKIGGQEKTIELKTVIKSL